MFLPVFMEWFWNHVKFIFKKISFNTHEDQIEIFAKFIICL